MSRSTRSDIAPALYEHLTAAENTEQAVEAMKLFLLEGDEEKFQLAVAIYVASARYRQEHIETVAAALAGLAGVLEGPQLDETFSLPSSRLHQLIFSGVLRAFYGDDAVDRALGARAQRKADAPQHSQRGTWPARPAE